MASAKLLLALVISFLVNLQLCSPSSPSPASLTLSLTYVDAERSLLRSLEADPADLPLSMPLRSFVAAGRAMRARLKKQQIRSGPNIVGNLSYEHQNSGDFYLDVAIGTPPQNLVLLVDTGSELTWSLCCSNCTDLDPPKFVPNLSSSFLTVACDSPPCTSNPEGFNAISSCITSTCNFTVGYGDKSSAAGSIANDSFHLTPYYATSMVFGCADTYNSTTDDPPGASGLMGLSSAQFSFPSQLFENDPDLERKFAHCLPDRFANLNAPGTIQFGNYELSTNLSYTPFVMPDNKTDFYYVKLEGIKVGNALIKVGSKEDVETIFDSGTALTNLETSVYNEFVEEIKKQTTGLEPFVWNNLPEQCYKVPLEESKLPNVPLVTFHFAGMVDLELKAESILYPAYSDDKSIYLCLAFHKAADTLNIIGNYQQQNYWVEYNLQTSHLGLAKAKCAT